MLATAIALLLPLSSPATSFDGQPDAQLIEAIVRSDVDNLAASATTDAKAVNVQIIPAAGTGEESFIDKHLPYKLAEDLHPEIEEELVVLWIVTAIAGFLVGDLWIPKILLKDLTLSDTYQDDALVNWLVHAIITVVGGVSGSFTVTLGWWFILLPERLYLHPVALINNVNRHAKGGGKKKGGGKSALSELPGMPTLAVSEATPSLAY